MTSAVLRERHLREWGWFILAVGVVLRFSGLDWDHNFLFNPDERNIATGAAALVWPTQLVPTFNAYNGLSIYLPRLLAELLQPLTGQSGTSLPAIVFSGRLLSALFSSGALLLLWAMGKRLFGNASGLFVLACSVACPALIQSAHFATTESALVLVLCGVLWLSLRHLDGRIGLLPYAVLVGALLGIGFGFKTTALIFSVVPAITVLQTTVLEKRLWPAVGAAAVASAVVVVLALLTTPQLWAATADYLATMRFEGGVVSGAQPVFWTYQFRGAPDGLFELSQVPWIFGVLLAPVAIAGVLAILFALVQRRRSAWPLAATVCFAIVYAVVICTWRAKFIRYEYMLIPSGLLGAGFLLTQVRTRRLRLALLLAVAITTGAAGLGQAMIYLGPDPRMAAWDWLRPQLASGQQVALEPVEVGASYYNGAAVKFAILPLIDPPSPQKAQTIASTLAGSDWVIVASRRHHAVLPRLRAEFPEMCPYYASLWSGRLGYQLVGRFMRRPVISWAAAPELWAEETFTVFDSPEVLVLRNVRHLSAETIAAQISAMPCPADGLAPTPPR